MTGKRYIVLQQYSYSERTVITWFGDHLLGVTLFANCPRFTSVAGAPEKAYRANALTIDGGRGGEVFLYPFSL